METKTFAALVSHAANLLRAGYSGDALSYLETANDYANSHLEQPYKGRAYELLDALDSIAYNR